MEKILYSKYSNERARRFAIRTDIRETADGGRVVVKQACFPEGEDHVANIGRWCEKLSAFLADTPFAVNRCAAADGCARIEYLRGRSLEEHLDELLSAGKEEETCALLIEYANQLRRAFSRGRFAVTPEFAEVFGDAALTGELSCAPVTDIDMVTGNVLERDGGWTLLDCEWTFDFPVPVDFVIYRALRYYLYGNQIRALLKEQELYAAAGVGLENQRAFEKMEEHFQAYVRGNTVVLAKLYEEISPGCLSVGTDAEKRAGARGANLRFEVFFDRGNGFSARDSYDILYGGGREAEFCIPAGGDVRKIRLDPPVDHCLLWLKNVSWEQDEKKSCPRHTSNGTEILPGLIAFDAEDAQLIFDGLPGEGKLQLQFMLEQNEQQGVLRSYFAQHPAGGASALGQMRARAAKTAGRLKKTAAKGVAYVKKNGVIRGVKRGIARLEKPENYPDWLSRNRQSEQDIRKMEEACRGVITDIRVVSAGECGEPEEGRWYLFVEESGRLEREALAVFARAVCEHPEAELFYCDSDRAGEGGSGFAQPVFKPDLDFDLLMSVNYIGAGFLASGSLLVRAGMKGECGGLYRILLACAANAARTVHIPRVLYHAGPGEIGGALCAGDCAREKKALQSYLLDAGIAASVEDGAMPGMRRVVYPLPAGEERPLVSILIPNRDHVEELSRCLESIKEMAGIQNYEILILENNSGEETRGYYRRAAAELPLRVLTYRGAFHFSRINNFGAEHAKGSYLLFLNNDTELCGKNCLAELLRMAAREDVGAVGARLYYPDGSIQHAGVIVGYGGVAGHAFEGFDKERQMQTPWIQAVRQYSAVTGACMMVRRDLFLSLGGFCEELGVAYNDVDLCLRIRALGKKVLYDPYAELLHYESKTRGLEITREKAERVRREAAFFCARWRDVLAKGDPFYNRNLTLEKPDFSLARRGERRTGEDRR